jgi:hypothetical protein
VEIAGQPRESAGHPGPATAHVGELIPLLAGRRRTLRRHIILKIEPVQQNY